MVYARVTTSHGRRHERAFQAERLAMNIHAGALTFAMKFDLAGSGT
jgi:hypothetical protein